MFPGGTIAIIESILLRALAIVASAATTAIFYVAPAVAWEPTRNVEFIVPAGTGGGADQMARMIQGIVAKHNLMKQSMVVINSRTLPTGIFGISGLCAATPAAFLVFTRAPCASSSWYSRLPT